MTATSLKAMAADPGQDGVKKTDIYRVDPRLLEEEDGFNLRDYDDPEVIEHIRGFADSYKSGRYVPPLLVRVADDGRVLIVEGHCRRRGALLAISEGCELAYLNCVSYRGNDADRVQVMLRSAEGLKLKPLAVAIGYLRLHRLGYESHVEIAEFVGKTASHVEQMLLLAQANKDVHKLVESGAVAASVAIEAVRKHREGAGAFLQEQLNAALKRGKGAVTKSALKEWLPPRKVVTSVIGSVDTMISGIDIETRRLLASLEKESPQEVQGKKVSVDAALLLDIFRAHAQVADAKQAKARADAEALEKASQQGIAFEGDGRLNHEC